MRLRWRLASWLCGHDLDELLTALDWATTECDHFKGEHARVAGLLARYTEVGSENPVRVAFVLEATEAVLADAEAAGDAVPDVLQDEVGHLVATGRRRAAEAPPGGGDMSLTGHLCTGQHIAPSECIGCGGSIHASMDGNGSPPFESPQGSLAPGLYCDEECWDSWEDYLHRERAAREARLACCPECGFDNREHDTGCAVAPGEGVT